ncbi:MAG: hypothetical protein AB7S75_07800 [Desulfococcaceae bacterium]
MKGNIYSDQVCSVCDSRFYHNPDRRGLFCPLHPKQKATGRFQVWFGRSLSRRFNTYKDARNFLDGLQLVRNDYVRLLPFSHVSEKWLKIKKNEVCPSSFRNLSRCISLASSAWGQTDVRNIRFPEIEDFLHSQNTLSRKTVSNMKSVLHSFFTWCSHREDFPVPRFPSVRYELGYRNTVDKRTQQKIIDYLHKNFPFKVWLGVKWLSTYISIRPKEMIRMREREVDAESGYFFIPHPKEKRLKRVPLISEDVDILRQVPRGLPDQFFFRHASGVSGCRMDQGYGDGYFYKCWKRACGALGIEGVDLYGGTRHSSALSLRGVASPEEIRRAMMTSTNKAFERYFRIEADEVRGVYERTRG